VFFSRYLHNVGSKLSFAKLEEAPIMGNTNTRKLSLFYLNRGGVAASETSPTSQPPSLPKQFLSFLGFITFGLYRSNVLNYFNILSSNTWFATNLNSKESKSYNSFFLNFSKINFFESKSTNLSINPLFKFLQVLTKIVSYLISTMFIVFFFFTFRYQCLTLAKS
jgi:hypothetical protein